jgi:predicted lipoprotein
MKSVAGLSLMLGMAACSPVALGDGDQRVVVREIASEVIVPTLEDLAQASDDLARRCDDLDRDPNAETLDDAQRAWRKARGYWKRMSAFGFGPAMQLRIEAAIDQFPVEPLLIDVEVVGDAGADVSYNVDYVEELGANRKGFHVIEQLLFHADGNDAALTLLADDADASRRLMLLNALAQHLELKVSELVEAWTAGGNSYRDVLTQPGESNDEYPTIKKAVDALVNESVFLSEVVADIRLGKPFGVANGGEPQPELEESALSDNSLQDITDSVKSIRNVYLGSTDGAPGNGITSLVQARSVATDHAVQQALDDALDAVADVPRPFSVAIVSHRAAVQRAYDAVKVLKRTLSTEVVGALGAALKFNDNDGD